MRSARNVFVTALGLATATSSVSAGPMMPNLLAEQDSAIVQIAGGCGRGWHPNWNGRCVPNHHRYYYRPYHYGYRYGYGDGHEPWNRPSLGDYGAADQLNRQQLGWHW
jgi:hypothetical protein